MKNIFCFALLASLLLSPLAQADEPSIDALGTNPTCFIYQATDGPHALVQGAVLGFQIGTRGLTQELIDNHGKRYFVDVVGHRYELDVPAKDITSFKEGRLTRHGFYIPTQRFKAVCRSNAIVRTGDLTAIKKIENTLDRCRFFGTL